MLDQIHPDLPPGVRTYGPSDVMDDFHIHEVEDEILAVRTKIERIYSGLPPAIHKKRSFEMGFCFGLLDPRSNIIVNSIIMDFDTSRDPLVGGGGEPSPPAGGGGREDVPPRARGVKRGREPLTPVQKLARRSLDGLTAFLTCLFPYLPDAEARRYLHFAGADPLVAAVLIVRTRRMLFDYSSQTTKAAVEVALRCAAVAADHPNPRRFVMGWKLVSTPALEALIPVSFVTPKGLQGNLIFGAPEGIKSVEKTAAQDTLLLPCPKKEKDTVLLSDVSWESAKERFKLASLKIQCNLLPPTRAHKKRMLLAKIHGFYIEALGRLPKVELCSCYHRSMLIGGYCFGPFDPVSNIILNTIWYEHHFPQTKQFEVAMISTQMLWRIVARSLYGLISFLCTLRQGVTPDQAIECLLATSVCLPVAVETLSIYPSDTTPPPVPLDFADAYAAAGTAAFHCSPRALSEFLASNIPFDPSIFPHSFQYGPSVSSEDISSICRVLEKYSSSSGTCQQQDVARTKVKKWEYAHICRRSHSFRGQHDRVTSMVRDALDRFNMTLADGQQFVLHIIFGVNEFVSGPVRSTNGKVGEYNPWTHDIYCRSHINFLARRKDQPLGTPTLFFAECGKDGDDTCWCVPMILQGAETGKSRCIYCEHQANRILHPVVEKFHGRDEFDELFYISDRRFYNNDRIITHNGINVDWVHDVSDAAIYLNSYPDDDDDGDEADWIVIY